MGVNAMVVFAVLVLIAIVIVAVAVLATGGKSSSGRAPEIPPSPDDGGGFNSTAVRRMMDHPTQPLIDPDPPSGGKGARRDAGA